jgi:hypothetical protein
VLLAGLFGGWAAGIDDGMPVFTYNYLAKEEFTIRGRRALPRGTNEILFDFDYDGGGPGKGGTMTISVGGQTVGKGRIEKTQPLVIGAETFGVGHDSQTPVVSEYGWAPDNHFRGGMLGAVKISQTK